MREKRKSRFCLVGANIQNSLSPKIFNYWFEKHNLRATYELKEIKPNVFEKEFLELLNIYYGLNVTSPYKKSCKKFLQHNDLSSINAIKEKKGFNTDLKGFLKALKIIGLRNNFYNSKKVLVLGRGGTAHTLLQKESLNKKRFDVLIRDKKHKPIEARGVFYLKSPPREEYEFVINCTTKKKLLFDKIKTKHYLDLNYTLEERGLFPKAMLLHQAAESFFLWFGFRPAMTKQLRKIVGI
ncbi:MAG: hypothetical protein RLN62_00430 [Rickettsiales bacterium]